MFGPILRRVHRFALTLGGEAMQSVFHFGLNIALVRTLPAHDYGVFAIVMLIGGVALGYIRALVGMPATLLLSQRPGSREALVHESDFGSLALALSGLAGLATALLLQLWLAKGALAGGLFVGLWSFRSYLRMVLLARRQQAYGGASDATFAICGIALGLMLIRPSAGPSLGTALAVLAAANAIAVAAGLVLRGAPLRITSRASTRRRLGRLWRQLAWSALGTTTATVQAQGQVLLVATIAGPAAYAPIAAVSVLLSPMRIMASAVANMMQPDLAALMAKGDTRGVRRVLTTWMAILSAVCVAYGGAVAASLPLLGTQVFEGHSKTFIAVLSWGISISFLLYVMPRILMEVLRQFRLITLISAVSGVAGMTAVAGLLAVSTPAWSLLGNLLSELIILAWSWAAALRAVRPSERRPATEAMPPVRVSPRLPKSGLAS